jgi:hypothetical protein
MVNRRNRRAWAPCALLASVLLLSCDAPVKREESPAQPVARTDTSESEETPREPSQEEVAADEALGGAREALSSGQGKLENQEKQRQTMRDLQSLGKAIDQWLSAAMGSDSARGDDELGNNFHNAGNYPEISHDELEGLLVPKYIASVPSTDAWGNPLEFRLRTRDFSTRRLYMIRSPGRDGTFSSFIYTQGAFSANDFGEDIIFADGAFAHWPENIKIPE